MNVRHKPMNAILTRIVQIILALMNARARRDLKRVRRKFVKVSKDFHYGSLFA